MVLKRGEKAVGAFISFVNSDHPLSEMGRHIKVSACVLVYLLLLARLCPGWRDMNRMRLKFLWERANVLRTALTNEEDEDEA